MTDIAQVVEVAAAQAAEEVVGAAVDKGVAQGIERASELIQTDLEVRQWQAQVSKSMTEICELMGGLSTTLAGISARQEAILDLAAAGMTVAAASSSTENPAVVIAPAGNPLPGPVEVEIPPMEMVAPAVPSLGGAAAPAAKRGIRWI